MARQHLTKNEVRAALRKKKKAGLLPPQECGSPRCGADLTDRTVPAEYAEYRLMFSLAVERLVPSPGGPKERPMAVWECPVCGWRSPKPHPAPDDLLRRA